MADTSTIAIGIVQMVDNGDGGFKIPDNPRFQNICHTGPTLTPNRQTQQSEKICGTSTNSRGRSNPTQLGQRPGGGWNFELEFNQFAAQTAEGVMANTWRKRQNFRTNRGGVDNVTGVSTGVVAVTSGTAFAAEDLVRTLGFDNDANNGVFLATAGDAAGVTLPGLIDESSPPVSAAVHVAGKAIAKLSLTDTAASGGTPATLEATGLTWSNYLGEGDWFKLGGVGWCRVQSVSGITASLDIVPAGFAGGTFLDNYTGYIWFGDTIRDGRRKVPYAVEIRAIQDDGTIWYAYWEGLYFNTSQWSGQNTQNAQIFTGSFDFIGIEKPGNATVTRLTGAVTVPAIPSKSFQTGQNVDLLLEDGVRFNAADAVTSMQTTLSHQAEPKGGFEYDAGIGLRYGDFDPSGNIETYLDAPERYNLLIESDPLAITYALRSEDAYGMLIDLPNAEYTGGQPNAQGRNSSASLSLPFSGYIDESNGYTAQLQLHYAVDATVQTA